MRALLNLFGRSPFAPLRAHMDKVAQAVHLVPSLFETINGKNPNAVEAIAQEISKLEFQADGLKRDIREHLPKSIFLPVDRAAILDVLSIQDSIADTAEDVGVLLSMRPCAIPPSCRNDFAPFLAKNLQAFESAHSIIAELDKLVYTSFSGDEALAVRQMVDGVSYLEHEVDLCQRTLLKVFFHCDELSAPLFALWIRVFERTSRISNLAENLGHRVSSMLELQR